MQTAWKGVDKSLKDESLSLRKHQIKCGLFFLRSISKPSSSGDDMPGCRHNSTVTRNLEIRHEAIVSVLAQWTSQTGVDELYLNGRVDRMLLDINPILSTKGRTTPLPFIAALLFIAIQSCIYELGPFNVGSFFFFFNLSPDDRSFAWPLYASAVSYGTIQQCLRIIWLKARSYTSSLDHVWKVFATP